ncbi:MAG TPA: FkbM family methyltransferase [bacterium]|nr:FkbM family methyltransferase [bacterium]
MRLRERVLTSWLRREWPAWGRVYAALGGADDARWQAAGVRPVRGRMHGFEMELDLANWSERLSWFLGRYHDLPLQQMLRRVLRPGDAFFDVGANLCMLTLVARAVVGDTGRVIACEPNPVLVARVRRLLQRNRLTDVALLHAAVGAATGTVELHEYGGHPGWGSLSARGPDGVHRTASWTVDCRTGDDILAQQRLDREQPLVVKVDVEGHETAVVHGLERTLARRLPLVFVEVVDEHLRRAGSSPAELIDALAQHGYRGYVLDPVRRGLFGHDVRLMPLQRHEVREVDALFVPPDGPLAARVAPLLAGR